MANDYFQDILPPQGGAAPKPSPKPAPPPPPPQPPNFPPEDNTPPEPEDEEVSEISHENTRSIRNITVSSRAGRRSASDMREAPPPPPRPFPPPPPRGPRMPRLWIWIVALVSVVLLGLILLLATRPTTITVTPRSQAIVLDAVSEFTAYPEGQLPEVLSYTLETSEFEDSAVVPASGTEQVNEKSSGKITVFNNYSTSPVTLIENTRFETPDGLIFRSPSKVSVPGKVGAQPGEITIDVVADATGATHNVGPIARFTLPGLRSNAAMYADVYARSSAAMTGGFTGERPIVDASAVENAKSEIRGRLAEKARTAVENRTNDTSVILPDLVRITYASLPATEEAGGSARIHEKALVEIPVFPAEAFAETIARGISADAEEGGVVARGVPALAAELVIAEEAPVFGSTPITFTLSGTAQLVWQVDAAALAEALAGREEAAFQAIIASFPGVEEARARVQPFWKNSFPADPNAIEVRVEEPAAPGA